MGGGSGCRGDGSLWRIGVAVRMCNGSSWGSGVMLLACVCSWFSGEVMVVVVCDVYSCGAGVKVGKSTAVMFWVLLNCSENILERSRVA